MYLKYVGLNGGGGGSGSGSFGSSATRAIAESLKNHPLIVQGKGAPVRVRMVEKTNLGHRKHVTVTVRALVSQSGRRTLQIIRSPDEPTPVSPKGPWECR